MATHSSVVKNQQTNIIVIAGDDDILQNILSIIQKSENRGQLDGITRDVITESTDGREKVLYKRRRTDLTCVICGDKCSGYNFNVISCTSCKSFFHRNASVNLSDLKCLTNANKCGIRFNKEHRMCRRCRLEKCLSVGMKRSSTDAEDKLNKLRQLEENRRTSKNAVNTYTQTCFMDASSAENEQSIREPSIILESQKAATMEQLQTTGSCSVPQTIQRLQCLLLTTDDHKRLKSLKLAYKRAFRITTPRHDISALARIIDQRSALLYSASLLHDLGMGLITFIRSIPGFEFLDGHDRFILAKYNSPIVVFMRICLTFDTNRGLVYDSEVESEEYAVACRQLARYCYGEQLDLLTTQLFRSIQEITDGDPIILQLMLVIMTFTKGISVEDYVTDEESILLHNKQVYEIQAIYTSLLFRYMIEKHSSYDRAVRQYSRLIQKVIQMQMLVRIYQNILEDQLVDTTDDEINPIMKSFLRLR